MLKLQREQVEKDKEEGSRKQPQAGSSYDVGRGQGVCQCNRKA
jgi:hypothetical protein